MADSMLGARHSPAADIHIPLAPAAHMNAAAGDVSISHEHVHISSARGGRQIRLDEIDGMERTGDRVMLHLATGEVVSLDAAEGRGADVSAAIDGYVRVLHEATRSLRALGSSRFRAGREQDAYFRPLMDARIAAERADEAAQRIAAFDAAEIRGAMERTALEFARARYPGSDSERRSLHERLLAELDEVLLSLSGVSAEAERARNAAPAVLFDAWRRWEEAVLRLFSSADRAWIAMIPILDGAEPEPQSLWRRLRGRRG